MRMPRPTLLLVAALAGGCSSSSMADPGTTDAGASDGEVVDEASSGRGDGSEAAPDGQAGDGSPVQAACAENGCVREVKKVATYGRELLTAFAAKGQTVANGIDVYTIRYWSDGDEVTGSVYVPDTEAPAGGFPVVVMSQFTTGIGEPCAPSKGQLGVGVASPTALRGMLTLVPDATSYGPAPVGVYLAGLPAGRAALDGARAVQKLQNATGKAIGQGVVFAGLSQGGHSTMAAAAEYPTYASEVDARGFVAVAPPANFRDGANHVITRGAGFGFFMAMRLFTWNAYYGLGSAPVFREPYASSALGWFETECEYMGADGAPGTLSSRFPANPADVVSDEILAMGKNDSWTAGWADAYAASQPIPSDIGVPLAIFQGSVDTTVPKFDTDVYAEQLRTAGAVVEYQLVEGGTHSTTALSPFTIAQVASDEVYAWIKARFAP